MVNWTAPTGVTNSYSGLFTNGYSGLSNPWFGSLTSLTGTLSGVTLSLNTTSATPAGSYTFNVQASGNCGGYPATSGTSAQVTLVVANNCTNPTSGGTITSDQTICNSSPPSGLTSTGLPLGYNGTLQYKWQSSVTSSSSNFLDIGSASDTYYSPGSLSQTTWYRRLSKVACDGTWASSGSSNVVKITVRPVFQPEPLLQQGKQSVSTLIRLWPLATVLQPAVVMR